MAADGVRAAERRGVGRGLRRQPRPPGPALRRGRRGGPEEGELQRRRAARGPGPLPAAAGARRGADVHGAARVAADVVRGDGGAHRRALRAARARGRGSQAALLRLGPGVAAPERVPLLPGGAARADRRRAPPRGSGGPNNAGTDAARHGRGAAARAARAVRGRGRAELRGVGARRPLRGARAPAPGPARGRDRRGDGHRRERDPLPRGPRARDGGGARRGAPGDRPGPRAQARGRRARARGDLRRRRPGPGRGLREAGRAPPRAPVS